MIAQEMMELLIERAADARHYARVERSGFHVGAAILTKNWEIITGCNVELNNTLMSICAERCAVCKAISMGYSEFEAIAVVSDSNIPVAPCGICRQFLLDFGKDIVVIMADCSGKQIDISTVGELSPKAFTQESKVF